MTDEIILSVNGKPHTVQASPETPLLYVLRNEIGLSGPHFGCGGEKCGACMVLVGAQPALSCHLPVSEIGQRRITTLEGLIEESMFICVDLPAPACTGRTVQGTAGAVVVNFDLLNSLYGFQGTLRRIRD